tara:strand:+ start:69 stop:245 length:177 start_codon:yes stop_codon:yes gene_type:complete
MGNKHNLILNYKMDEKIILELAKEIVDKVEKQKTIYDAVEETVEIIKNKFIKNKLIKK